MYVFFPFVSSGTVQGRATTSLRPGKGPVNAKSTLLPNPRRHDILRHGTF